MLNARVLICLASALTALAALPGTAGAQAPRSAQVGAPCAPGEFGYGSGLLVCAEGGTFRYALHDDVPPVPDGGYTSRPAWFPTLAQQFGRPATACPLTGRVTFTHPVMAVGDVTSTIPQGMMVREHVTPIDHGYFSPRTLAIPRALRTDTDWLPVYAPADGTITEVSLLGSPTSIRVTIEHACETYSIYMVLNRVAGVLGSLHDELMVRQYLNVSIPVLAGTLFGEQRDNPLDFSVHDGAAWLSGFVAPFSYTMLEAWKPFTVDPWRYVSPDLAEAYEARMQRVAPPRWGVIDLDIAGTASGNWFLAGTMGYSGRSVEDYANASTTLGGGAVEGRNSYAWSHLSLVPHWVQPSRWIFSTGWWADPAGDATQRLMVIPPGVPPPSALTPDSGTVAYRVTVWSVVGQEGEAALPIGYELEPGQTPGVVAIRVNADQTLTVEVFPALSDPAQFTGFTPAMRTYRR
ncbi:MAG: hypothetical protein Q7J25_11070 [Vicinamibacterales bacterium]|nr:hypothetical protein [Vicinamibacterales bacterium]